MTKFKLLFALLLFIGVGNSLYGDNEGRKNIQITDMLPVSGVLRSDTPTTTIEATLDFSMEAIEFLFIDDIGTVTITVESMGMVVSSAKCSTSTQPILWLSVPIVVGDYDITISGSSYEGVGTYSIKESDIW